MSFDSLALRAVAAQLNKTVIGGKILSVIQSSPLEFTLRIAAHGDLYNLLFCIHPSHARIHLTTVSPRREKRWHFADFLLKHMGDGEIAAIEQVNLDRIISIRIIPQGEIIEPTPKILIGEFMGKHSNVALVEEDTSKILESMKHIDETMIRYRQVLPGLDYVMPPMNQAIDPFSTDEDTFSAILASDDAPLWRKLLKNFQGMSPLLAKEIVARTPDSSPEVLRNTFMSVMADIQADKLCPTVITRDNDGQDVLAVSAIDMQQLQDNHAIEFPDISSALEFFYQRLTAKELLLAEKAAILQAVKKKYEARREKCDSLAGKLSTAENAEDLRLKGELLIANLHRVQRGQKEISFQNFYDPDGPEVSIELDEKLSPSNNAQKYFTAYKKAKRSKDVVAKLMAKEQTALKYLQKVMEATEEAVDTIDPIRGALVRRGIMRERKTDTKKRKEEAPLFRRLKSSDGFQIYVGRNDKENGLLLKGESSKNDMWLHAKQIEGSHVIIRNPDKKPDIPRRTLLEAAVIAAHFSKAKHSGIVPVDYTWVKYVRKPRGAKPGFVIYTHEKTLFVSPSDANKLSAAP